MVHSQINKQLVYDEDSEIEKKDHNFTPLKYPIEISFDDSCEEELVVKFYITFGKKNERFLKSHHIIYYPIYLIVGQTVVSKIGVLEIEPEQESRVVDDEDNIDPEKLQTLPLFFSFLSESYLSLKNAIVTSMDSDDDDEDDDDEDKQSVVSDDSVVIITGKSQNSDSLPRIPLGSEPPPGGSTLDGFAVLRNPSTDEDDMFDIPNSKLGSRNQPESSSEKSFFTTDTSVKMPKTLVEETKHMAEKNKSEYQESAKNEWIENYMRNNHYGIQDNEGGGDCLFAVIRDAFQEIGKMTTIEALRELLSAEATDDIFQQYRTVYLAMEDGIVENDKEMKTLMSMIKEYKRRTRSPQTFTKTEHTDILEQARKATNRMENLKNENKENAEFLRYNFGFMKHIDSLNTFQEYIKTSKFWADGWAISTLEHKLNVKLIVLSEESFQEGSLDSVLNCGEASQVLQKRGKFAPDYYIMTSYSGVHYKLITYKDRKIFDFAEIPYDIKVLVLNKCMERNSGIFYLIQDFRNLKSKIGLNPDEGEPDTNDDVDDEYLGSLYDPEIIFVLDSHAPIKKEPGTTAQGEHIPADKKRSFMKLSKIKSWRRKLHDSWTDAPFTVDGKRWASVEHYYQGAKFRKHYPDFYMKFSLDSPDSDFNKEVVEAKIAGRKSHNKYRSDKITIDPDFYDGERNHQERQLALKSKFESNLDLKEILLLTQSAKLVNFVRQSPPEIDMDIMNLRRTYQ